MTILRVSLTADSVMPTTSGALRWFGDDRLRTCRSLRATLDLEQTGCGVAPPERARSVPGSSPSNSSFHQANELLQRYLTDRCLCLADDPAVCRTIAAIPYQAMLGKLGTFRNIAKSEDGPVTGKL